MVALVQMPCRSGWPSGVYAASVHPTAARRRLRVRHYCGQRKPCDRCYKYASRMSAHHRGFLRCGAFAAGVIVLTALVAADQTPGYIPPRTPDGKPDLNGIWQALNTANYDLQAHSARAAMAMRPGPAGPIPAAGVLPLGAVGAVPAGLWVVEGDEIPYQPGPRPRRSRTPRTGPVRPRDQVLPAGRAARDVHAVPFQIVQNERFILFAYEYASAVRVIHMTDPGPPPIDTWMGQSRRPLGGRHARRRRDGLQRSGVVRSRRELRQRVAARRRAIHAHRPDHMIVRGHDRGPEGVHATVEDQHAALSSRGEERAAARVQVRRVRGGAPLWALAQTAHPIGEQNSNQQFSRHS